MWSFWTFFAGLAIFFGTEVLAHAHPLHRNLCGENIMWSFKTLTNTEKPKVMKIFWKKKPF